MDCTGSKRVDPFWVPRVVAAADLGRVGASGQYLGQEAQMGTLLYEAISLPIPQHVGRPVTIGVQRVAEGGLQSDFMTVPGLISPLIS